MGLMCAFTLPSEKGEVKKKVKKEKKNDSFLTFGWVGRKDMLFLAITFPYLSSFKEPDVFEIIWTLYHLFWIVYQGIFPNPGVDPLSKFNKCYSWNFFFKSKALFTRNLDELFYFFAYNKWGRPDGRFELKFSFIGKLRNATELQDLTKCYS